MKNIHLLKILFLTLCVMPLGSCSDDKDEEFDVYQLTIASVQPGTFFGEKIDWSSGTSDQYFAKIEGEENWSHHFGIPDFSFTEGYEYVLKVRRQRQKYSYGGSNECRAPSADAYILILEDISKVEKDSENIPVQNAGYLIASKSTGDEEMPYYAQLNDGSWSKIPQIIGFEFEEGYETLVYFYCIYNGKDAPNPYTFGYRSSSQKEKRDTEGLPQ